MQRLRRWRRRCSRAHWVARLLHYELPEKGGHRPGLILLQIDGLSHEQFQRAMKRNRLPYLRRLRRLGYLREAGFYSGLPSSTPAVQAELFYGKKSAVPSFAFQDRSTGKNMRMYDAECAKAVARDLRREHAQGILDGGTSYANIYAGGAQEARFCAETMDLEAIWSRGHPMKWVLIYGLYVVKFVRLLALVIVELALAVTDFFRGLYERRHFWQELKFVPVRAGICVALREMVQFMVELDIERGVNVIHANFLGYDEQAHRRGPRSAFAHWTLKGIDRAIRDIHRAALRSEYRDYQLIVYSDHGQESVQIYRDGEGRLIREAVRAIVAQHLDSWSNLRVRTRSEGNYLADRGRDLLRWLRIRASRETVTRTQPTGPEVEVEVEVAAMGPLGHVYLPQGDLSSALKGMLARQLVHQAGVPLVLYCMEDGSVRAVNGQGQWYLPGNTLEVLGPGHRFADEVIEDLVAVCRHANAGDLVLSGWRPEKTPLTFAVENGAHAGPGHRETHGVVLIPEDLWPDTIKADAQGDPYLRALDLRELVLRAKAGVASEGQEESHKVAGRRAGTGDAPVLPEKLNVVTYNIHSCIGTDGKTRPGRIIALLRQMEPDVVALQEVDANRARTSRVHQTELIAAALGMDYVFLPLLRENEESYGLAILSRLPFTTRKAASFPSPFAPGDVWEPRGAIWICLSGAAGPVHLVNTHFGLSRRERRHQLQWLTGEEWLGGVSPEEPVILCGDFNAGENSGICKQLRRRYGDVQRSLTGHRPQGTFVSFWPVVRLDHIFVSQHFKVRRVEVPRHFGPRVASDHLPVCSELELMFVGCGESR